MITEQIKKEITEQFQLYKKELNISRNVTLELKGIGNSGEYINRNGVGLVRLQNGTIKQWLSYPERTKFALIHELVHAKYDDIKKPILNTPLVFPNVILNYLLRELRANTIAYQKLGSNNSILIDYFFNYYGYYAKGEKYVPLSAGYVTDYTNVKLIMANPIWNEQAIVDAIEYFTSLKTLRFISKGKIEEVKNKFIEQLED